MKIIIYDTEFTAWQGSAQRNWQGPNEFKELIQVSAVKIQLSNNEILLEDELHEFVKPKINPQLSTYIQELTLISQHEVDAGLSASDFFANLQQFCDGGQTPIYSWGNDYHVLQETATINQVDIGWVNSFNLAPLFHANGVPQDTTSGCLFKHFNLDLEVHEHNAKDDVRSLLASLQYFYQQQPQTVHHFLSRQP